MEHVLSKRLGRRYENFEIMSNTPETAEIVKAYEQQRESVGGIIEHAEALEKERDELKAALAKLDAIYRADLDEPPTMGKPLLQA